MKLINLITIEYTSFPNTQSSCTSNKLIIEQKQDKTLIFYKEFFNQLLGMDVPPNHRIDVPNINNNSPSSYG
jgi:hypothetical protein